MEKAIKVADDEVRGCTNVSKAMDSQVLPQTTKSHLSPVSERYALLRRTTMNSMLSPLITFVVIWLGTLFHGLIT